MPLCKSHILELVQHFSGTTIPGLTNKQSNEILEMTLDFKAVRSLASHRITCQLTNRLLDDGVIDSVSFN